jgi:iron-siderophore transport system permease protein
VIGGPSTPAGPAQAGERAPPGSIVMVLGGAALALVAGAGLVLGASTVPPAAVVSALTAFDGSPQDVTVVDVRLPRVAVAAVVGASLGVAGALMQTITRNPLAEPSLLGVSWGAALAAVGAQVVVGIGTAAALVPVAIGGAAIAGLAILVLAASGRAGLTPERLIVAGAAVSGLLAALVQGLLVLDSESLGVARRWLAGSLSGANWDALVAAAPYLVAGTVISACLVRPLSALALGDDVARGLGVRTGLVKGAAALAVVALAGGSVALAGPIILVGLAVPHAARALVGHDLAPQLPACAVLGAGLVIVSDIVARVVVAPEELPVGVLTALVGAPVLLHIARRGVTSA